LAQRGVRILRFTNDEIERHLPDVLKRIIAAALTPPSPPAPLPSDDGRGGQDSPSQDSPSPDGTARRERGPGGEG
jgi:hypothetical protein